MWDLVLLSQSRHVNYYFNILYNPFAAINESQLKSHHVKGEGMNCLTRLQLGYCVQMSPELMKYHIVSGLMIQCLKQKAINHHMCCIEFT